MQTYDLPLWVVQMVSNRNQKPLPSILLALRKDHEDAMICNNIANGSALHHRKMINMNGDILKSSSSPPPPLLKVPNDLYNKASPPLLSRLFQTKKEHERAAPPPENFW